MDHLIGRNLGPYELLDKLGAGGMGAVYRAVHQALRQPRAIKVLHPHLAADPGFVERFLLEARTAAGLRHPNIVQIYDVGEQDGVHYIAMELLEGRSPRELVRSEGPLPDERAVRLLGELASALGYAHARGITHRDGKPANIIVGPDDRVTLVDFGIARAAAETALTTTGIVGTPEYMAPEVISGTGGGKSADLYALGVVAYELLTGRVPFAGPDSAAVMYAHVNKPPPSPRSLRPDLPETVEAILLRQLAKDPGERFPDGTALISALASARSMPRGTHGGTSPLPSPEAHTVRVPVPGLSSARPRISAAGSSPDPPPPQSPPTGARPLPPPAWTGPQPPATRVAKAPRRRAWPLVLAGILGTVLALAMAVYVWRGPPPPPPPSGPTATPPAPTDTTGVAPPGLTPPASPPPVATPTTSATVAPVRPALSGYGVEPRTVAAGGPITLRYDVTNPGATPITATLGASIRPAGGTQWTSDPENDTRVDLQPGRAAYTRTFRVPEAMLAGTYDVALGA
jgi:eukaryotic-like serine/threonine-protein kinase